MMQYFSCFAIHSVFYPCVELIANNLNISTAEKNKNKINLQGMHNINIDYFKIMIKENNLKDLAWLAGAESKF